MVASTPRDVHLLVCAHGMWGIPSHLASVEKAITARFTEDTEGPELVTLLFRTNADSFTYDGMDWCAERAVKEIYEKVEEIEKDSSKKVTRFSVFGYSLGGLISRYAIGILYQRGFFNNVKPVNFTTFATPHIGLPRFRGVVGSAMHKLGPVMLSRTGRQFYCVDDEVWSPGAEAKPLIGVMADKDSIFFKALSLFPHMTIYGNAVHDLTVTYCTAMIEPHDPFTELSTKNNRLAVKIDPEYKHIIESFFKVPEGEEVPLHELEKARRAERDAIPWYKPSHYRTGRPWVPPFLKLPFPLNIVFYMMSPFLLPLALTYAAVRFRRESAESRKRLAMITTSPEADSSLGALMRKMERVVAATMDPDNTGMANGWDAASDLEEGGSESEEKQVKQRKSTRADTPEGDRRIELLRGAGSLPSPAATPGSRTPLEHKDPLTTTNKSGAYPEMILRTTPDESDPSQPVLTEAQLEMIKSLNSIPQLKKVRAFFPFSRNAHSMIVARDVEKFPFHVPGLEVVRHWADRFVL